MASQEDVTSNLSEGWSSWREALGLVATRRSLGRSITVTLVVGSAFFAMNQLPVILAGRAGFALWLKALLTYFTPLIVSNVGMLSATRQRLSPVPSWERNPQ